MLPSSLALVRQAFADPAGRARAVAVWSAGGAAAIAAGPVLGGLLTSALGWRSIFFINLPIGAVTLVLAARAPLSPDAPDLAALVGELVVKSPDFGRLWGRYEVRRAGAGDRVLRHPLVGTMQLAHETLGLNRTDGHGVIVYLAEPGTPDHDAMVLLDRADIAHLATRDA